jgi:3-deoxy-D-manno-octulosonic-acid transferase
MRFLLDFFYLVALVISSPWLLYRASRARSLGLLPMRFGLATGDSLRESIWLHGSSVGEVSLLRPLVRLLEDRYPGLPIVVSSHTLTGFKAARLAYPAHRVLLFPLDLSFVQGAVLRSLNPLLIVVVESDLWPNHLMAAARRDVAVAVVNAKLSEKSLRRHRRLRIVSRALRGVALVAAQTEEHAARFGQLGVDDARIEVTGNMKYDLAVEGDDAGIRDELRNRLGIGDAEVVVIGGSLHVREDEDLLAAHAGLAGRGIESRLIIVPRYPEQSGSVVENARRAGFDAVTKTAVDRNGGTRLAPGTVLVVDTLGELRRFYAAADIAFVGGSLYYRGANKGGHNLMEPAILGLPVLFGPYNFSFKETVVDLLADNAGILVHDRDELGRALSALAGSKEQRTAMGERARRVVLDGQGASARNLNLLAPLIDQARSCRGRG